MKADKNELERLTARYASGDLTADEREKLFAAALEDQVLFEALAHEDAVRDVLGMPGAKERVIAAEILRVHQAIKRARALQPLERDLVEIRVGRRVVHPRKRAKRFLARLASTRRGRDRRVDAAGLVHPDAAERAGHVQNGFT